MSRVIRSCTRCGKMYAVASVDEATVCPACQQASGKVESISTAMDETRHKIPKLALIGGAIGLICALTAIGALFWFDRENIKPGKGISELDAKRAEQSNKAKKQVWNGLKDKLPKVPQP